MNASLDSWARKILAAGAALLAMAAQAADPWPVKPIKIVIPFSAGGVQDTLARSISNELGAALGQPTESKVLRVLRVLGSVPRRYSHHMAC